MLVICLGSLRLHRIFDSVDYFGFIDRGIFSYMPSDARNICMSCDTIAMAYLGELASASHYILHLHTC